MQDCVTVSIGRQQDGLAKVEGLWDWFGGKVGLFHTLQVLGLLLTLLNISGKPAIS